MNWLQNNPLERLPNKYFDILLSGLQQLPSIGGITEIADIGRDHIQNVGYRDAKIIATLDDARTSFCKLSVTMILDEGRVEYSGWIDLETIELNQTVDLFKRGDVYPTMSYKLQIYFENSTELLQTLYNFALMHFKSGSLGRLNRRQNPIYYGQAGAGILFFCGREILLTLRSKKVEQPGTWGIPGGNITDDKYYHSLEMSTHNLTDDQIWDGAVRETIEELGSFPDDFYLFDKTIFKRDNFTYTTFLVSLSDQTRLNWRFQLNWENDVVKWFPVYMLPHNLHAGVEFVIQQKPEYFK